MLVIKTIVHETIWGGERLTPYSNTDSKKIGHLYSLIYNKELESEILKGKYKGQLFRKYFDENIENPPFFKSVGSYKKNTRWALLKKYCNIYLMNLQV